MFNPFKKKEEPSYKLDEISLPSMNSNSSPPGLSSPPGMDANSEFGGQPNQNPTPNFDNHPASTDSAENMQFASDQPFNQTQFPSQDMNSSFNYSPPSGSSQSFSSNPNKDNFSSPFSSSTPNSSSDMSSIQLETIDKKISLLDTRISIMEDKINKIYEMISMEVSPQTKMKVSMNSKQSSSQYNNQ